jgi:tRNA (cmo5U34)-methyltransferase
VEDDRDGGWDPDRYDEVVDSVPGYAALQQAAIDATEGASPVAQVLELGVGTGETTQRLLAAHPAAHLVGIDGSAAMLGAARASLPDERVTLSVGRIEDPLPAGRFDLVVSVLAVHHLTDPDKAALFGRVRRVLTDRGVFVLGDVVVPRDPSRALVELEDGVDLPAPIDAQVTWLRDAGFDASVAWERDDLAVFSAVAI